MSSKRRRFLAWLFDEKPVGAAVVSPAPRAVEVESGGREPRWYEREQLGEGNIDEHGRLKTELMPPLGPSDGNTRICGHTHAVELREKRARGITRGATCVREPLLGSAESRASAENGSKAGLLEGALAPDSDRGCPCVRLSQPRAGLVSLGR